LNENSAGFPLTKTSNRVSPEKPKLKSELLRDNFINKDGFIQAENSEITVDQALAIFNYLPVDITFVDENDTVKFYSNPKDRIFPRSPAIIGRKVQNCHPPESVHVVEDIVNAFRKGERDVAQFWLELNGKFLLIQYFAIRDNAGKYGGVLEVSQDVTEIRKLKGERRLLQWQ